MLTIVLLMNIVQLFAAQRMLNPQVINSTMGTCPPQYMRDLARQNLSQSVLNIIANITTVPSCGPGQWTRVAYLNMSDPVQQCPSSWRLYATNGVRACGRSSGPGCNSQNYTVQQRYNKVCGRIIGYQFGTTDAFGEGGHLPVDQPYVDGVSVTYGIPRKHVWTFASGFSETTTYPQWSCPCAFAGTPQPPSYVGNNYYCESGNPRITYGYTGTFRYTDDPLWDGQGCDSEGQCCSNTNSPPWFSVDLPFETNEHIEIRICAWENIDNDDTPIGLLDIYVK